MQPGTGANGSKQTVRTRPLFVCRINVWATLAGKPCEAPGNSRLANLFPDMAADVDVGGMEGLGTNVVLRTLCTRSRLTDKVACFIRTAGGMRVAHREVKLDVGTLLLHQSDIWEKNRP